MTTPTRAPRRRRSPQSTPALHAVVTSRRTENADRPVADEAGSSGRDAVRRPFRELPLHAYLHQVLDQQGLTTATPIQSATLADGIAGRDVLGRARTGSGKTLAFGLAMLTRLAGRHAQPGQPIGLILVPTRELAAQVADALAPYAAAVRLTTTVVVGGLSLNRQADALRRGADIVIATPGRLNDLVNRGDCRLDRVELTVLDEADQMADMGFLPQVTALLTRVAPDGQRMLFSATLDSDVDRLVRRFLTEPVRHSVDPPRSAVTTLDHHLLHVDQVDKNETAAHIGARDGRVIMFVGTKHRADRLARHLTASGIRAAALHGGKSQPQRTRALDGFKTGTVTTLVATSLAARGIHVDDVDLVVNIDPPVDSKEYLHRGGRTARAGRSGTVVTLVLPEQQREASRLLAAAGVTAQSNRVRPGDAHLARVTGARTPSGVPVPVPAVAGGHRPSTGSSGRPALRRPRPAAAAPEGRRTRRR